MEAVVIGAGLRTDAPLDQRQDNCHGGPGVTRASLATTDLATTELGHNGAGIYGAASKGGAASADRTFRTSEGAVVVRGVALDRNALPPVKSRREHSGGRHALYASS